MAVANSAMIRSGSIISRVAAGAGLATLGMGIMSLRAAGNYEQSMDILGAVSEANKKQMKAMGDEAIKLGADLKLPNVSAKDAAQAMQELAKGGLSVNDILSSTRGTLQLGLAANMGFADSATVVARALQAFNLDGSKATMVADLFTAAANKSTAEMTDIALGFQMASAQFKAGDQTISGLTTSLTLMANAGIVGSDAGTSLKTMMNRLMAPTKKAKELMADMGISVYDSAGNMRPMPALIGEFTEATKGMTKEQKNAALYTIFGSDAIRASRVMLDAGAKGWLEMEKRITKGGEAQAYAEARTKGFNGALQAFGSVAETLAINLGTALLPAATSLVRTFTAWLAAIDPAVIIGFVAAIVDSVKWIYNLIAGSDLLTAAVGGLVAGLIAYKTISMTIAAVTRIWAIAQGLLNAAMMLNPVALVIAALVGLGVALYIAYQRSEQFRAIVNSVFNWLKSNVPPIMAAVKNAVTTAWNTISSATQAVWDAVSSTVMGVVNAIRSHVTANFNTYRTVITAAWNVIRALTLAVWNVISTTITSVIDVIRGKISAMQAFRNIVSAVWSGIKAVTSAAWESIKDVVRVAVDQIPGIISAVASLAATAARDIGLKIIQGILGGVSGLGSALKDKISGMIGGALSSIDIPGFSPPEHAGATVGKMITDGMVRGILLGGMDMPEKISEKIKKALEAGVKQVDAYRGVFQKAFSQLSSDAMSAFDAITSAHMTPSEKKLDTIENARAKKEREENLKNAKNAFSALLAATADYRRRESESDAEYAQRIKEEEAKLIEQRLQAKKDFEDAQWAITQFNLQRAAEAENLQYQARRDLQKRHLEAQLAEYEQQMMLHPEKAQFWQDKITATLRRNGVTYKAAGKVLGLAFAQGMRESFDEVERTAKAIAALVARYLRLNSPAEAGPLSKLDTWWKDFGRVLTSGLDMRPIEQGALAMAGAVGPGMGAGAYMGALSPANAGVQAGTVQYITVEGSLIRESELDDRIREGNIRNEQRGLY